MSYRWQQWLCMLISILMGLVVLGALNYMVSRADVFERLPFSLESHETLRFVHQEEADLLRFNDLIDIDHDRDVTLLSIDRSERTVGLYDPALFYYREKMEHGVGFFERYFSDQDYRTGADVSVAVSHSPLSWGEQSELVMEGNDRGGQYLFVIVPQFGQLYEPWIDEIRNPAAVSLLGTEIYIRSSSPAVLSDFSKRLTENGYREEALPLPTLFTGLAQAWSLGRVKEQLTVVTACSLYLCFAVAACLHHGRYKKQMAVEAIYGARYITMSRHRVRPFVYMQVMAFVLTVLGTAFLADRWFDQGFSEGHRMVLLSLHSLLMILLYQIGFSWQYCRLHRLTGGEYAV